MYNNEIQNHRWGQNMQPWTLQVGKTKTICKINTKVHTAIAIPMTSHIYTSGQTIALS